VQPGPTLCHPPLCAPLPLTSPLSPLPSLLSPLPPPLWLQPIDKVGNSLALGTSPVVRALFDPDGAMQDIRNLDPVSLSLYDGCHDTIQQLALYGGCYNVVTVALGYLPVPVTVAGS